MKPEEVYAMDIQTLIMEMGAIDHIEIMVDEISNQYPIIVRWGHDFILDGKDLKEILQRMYRIHLKDDTDE